MLLTVGALMAGEKGPTPEQLYQAITATQSLAQKVPNQPWPYLAQCEIATRLGQTSALEQCGNQLQRLSPASANLRGTGSTVMATHTHWFVWMAWLTLALACAVTAMHALASVIFRARRRSAVHLTQLILVVLGLCTPSRVVSQSAAARTVSGSTGSKPADLGRAPINDKDPEGSVPTPQQRDADPLNYAYFVMDVTARAEKAVKQEDYKTAVRYFRALVKAVPNRSIGYAKLCKAYEALGDWPNALENCRIALAHDGVTDGDYARYAHLLMEHKTRLAVTDVQDLDAIVQQLRTATPHSNTGDVVECEVGLKLHDKQRLQRCTANLVASAPSDPKTLSFQWAYSVERGDYAGAKALLERLKQTAISPKALQKMEEATSLARPWWKRALRSWWALSVLVLIVLAAAITLMSRRHQQQPATAK